MLEQSPIQRQAGLIGIFLLQFISPLHVRYCIATWILRKYGPEQSQESQKEPTSKRMNSFVFEIMYAKFLQWPCLL